MLTIGLFLSLYIYCVSGDGQLIILSAPSSLEYSGNDEIDASEIRDVIDASLGYTPHKASNWPGFKIKNPFDFPEAVIVVAVEGVSSLGDFDKQYPIANGEDESETFKDVQNDVLERYPMLNQATNIKRVQLGFEDPSVDDISVTHLNKERADDANFLKSLKELKLQVEDYDKNALVLDGMPKVHWYVLTSLHNLDDMEGVHSPAVLEAKQLVRKELIQLSKNVRNKNGKDSALVMAIISDGAHTRRVRSPTPKDGDNNTTTAGGVKASAAPGNRATVYSEDYPAIFNIILWFSVAFVFSLIAVSYFIAAMDPGRDSIIYRMTSNRMKKDS